MQGVIGTNSIDDTQNSLEAMLHGTTLNQITDLFGMFNRAARRVLEDVDPQETKIFAQFGQVWDGVFDYPVFTDLKGNKIIDFAPQANRQLSDNYSQLYNKQFDLYKNFTVIPDFTPRYSNGIRTIRINARNLNTGVQINNADGVNTNGLWVAGGNASNIQTDPQYFTDGASGSVSFQLAQTGIAGSTGYLENSTMSAINLTAQYNNAYEFFQTYLPNASGFSNIKFRFGTDSANYYEFSAITTDFMGNAWVNGWNQQGKSWTTATTTGSPTLSNIKYIKIEFTYDGTLQTQVRINQFWSRLGVIFNMEYYSKYLFRDATSGVFQEKVTNLSNIVNLDTDSYNLFLYASGIEAVQQQQGLDAMFFDNNDFEGKYQNSLAAYRSKYKSEITKPTGNYYRNRNASYRRYFGFAGPGGQ